MKSRERGRIVNVALVVTVGATDDRKRENLGVDAATQEDGAGRLAFLRGLGQPRFAGAVCVTSDAIPMIISAYRSRVTK